MFQFPNKIPNIALPIGISFYTFQLLSYVVDVYRQKIPAQTQYWKLLLYASMFHQCIAGPIVRYQTVADEIDHRQTDSLEISRGIKRFCVGLTKKAILANGCATVVSNLLPTDAAAIKSMPTTGLWIGLLFTVWKFISIFLPILIWQSAWDS